MTDLILDIKFLSIFAKRIDTSVFHIKGEKNTLFKPVFFLSLSYRFRLQLFPVKEKRRLLSCHVECIFRQFVAAGSFPVTENIVVELSVGDMIYADSM